MVGYLVSWNRYSRSVPLSKDGYPRIVYRRDGILATFRVSANNRHRAGWMVARFLADVIGSGTISTVKDLNIRRLAFIDREAAARPAGGILDIVVNNDEDHGDHDPRLHNVTVNALSRLRRNPRCSF